MKVNLTQEQAGKISTLLHNFNTEWDFKPSEIRKLFEELKYKHINNRIET